MANQPVLPKPLDELFSLVGDHVPLWVFLVLGALVTIGVLHERLAWLGRLLRSAIELITRRRGGPDQQKYLQRRRMFAAHLASQIERLNQKEDWRDDHFAELEAEVEAEVEAEGRRRRSLLAPWRRSSGPALPPPALRLCRRQLRVPYDDSHRLRDIRRAPALP